MGGSGDGSSGGGGGGSGQVSYPAYMEAVHSTWLDALAVLVVAGGDNPFTGEVAYDPSAPIAAVDAEIVLFKAVVDALASETDWAAKMAAAKTYIDANIIDDTYVDADIAAYAAVLDDQINNITLPRFQAGMRDINAVMSSAFVVGEAFIEGMRNRDVAKYGTGLREKLHLIRDDMIMKGADRMLSDLIQNVSFNKAVADLTYEANRLEIVALKEESDQNLSIEESEALWPMEKYQFAANMLAAIGGGTAIPNSGGKQKSKAASVLGGALSGGAAGGMATGGNPIGIGVGAALGIGAALMN